MANQERVDAAELRRVVQAIASGQYVLKAGSDGSEPFLCRIGDGSRVEVPDDVMEYMISEGLIAYMPDQ